MKSKPGSSRLMVINADGLHVASMQGTFKAEGCEFIGLGDDAMYFLTVSLCIPNCFAIPFIDKPSACNFFISSNRCLIIPVVATSFS